jgi:arsenite oxidase small subunit
MAKESRLKRRTFVKLCASAAAMITASPRLLAQDGGTVRRYQRTKLVDVEKRPIRVADLEEGENYLFHYPFISTPCFLLNLGQPTAQQTLLKTEDGRPYLWEGGIGPRRTVVAFSAICAHKMTHPARAVSFINYRHKNVNFQDKDKNEAKRASVIYCCSEKSVYDPAQGARVLGGPAPQPLAAILLDYNEADGSIDAIGTYGGDMFDKFFKEFSFRLQLEHQVTNVRQEVNGTTRVVKLTEYCATQVLCG